MYFTSNDISVRIVNMKKMFKSGEKYFFIIMNIYCPSCFIFQFLSELQIYFKLLPQSNKTFVNKLISALSNLQGTIYLNFMYSYHYRRPLKYLKFISCELSYKMIPPIKLGSHRTVASPI